MSHTAWSESKEIIQNLGKVCLSFSIVTSSNNTRTGERKDGKGNGKKKKKIEEGKMEKFPAPMGPKALQISTLK